MTTTVHHNLVANAWTKIAAGAGRKILRREVSAAVIVHIGKASPSAESRHCFSARAIEEFDLVEGDAIWARASDGAAEIVVIG